MLITLYKTLLRASTPLLGAYLRRRLQRGKEDALRGDERRGIASRARPDGVLVWLHAASVGESISLLSIVRGLLAQRPDIQVLMTTGTVTSAQLMAERLPKGAFHQYIPVDHPVWTRRFLDHWKPDMVVWSESELWPAMLDGVLQRKIPAVLLNARMSEASFLWWGYARGFAKHVLSSFTLCLAQNETEAQRLRHLGASCVEVSGNLKYAANPLPFSPQELAQMTDSLQGRPCVLWASTHPGEEVLALALHRALEKSVSDVLTIIVPRHPVRGAEIVRTCQDAGLSVAQRSAGDKFENQPAIYVADTMGELGLFYRLCKNVVMGGTFADIGGHNPIEPAQVGCLIFFGPQGYNFIGICDDFRTRHAMVFVDDMRDLESQVARALASPQEFAEIAIAARDWTDEKSHIADEIVQKISLLLPVPHKDAARERLAS